MSQTLRQEQQRWPGFTGAGTAVEGCTQKDPGWRFSLGLSPSGHLSGKPGRLPPPFLLRRGLGNTSFLTFWFFCHLCAQSLPEQNGLLSPWILPAVWTTLTWLVFLCLSLIHYPPLETKKNSLLISGLRVYHANRQTNKYLPSSVYNHGETKTSDVLSIALPVRMNEHEQT